jgi:diguanylate cyclase (GGDEF)-like protein/PAS domain S-box-containing protein
MPDRNDPWHTTDLPAGLMPCISAGDAGFFQLLTDALPIRIAYVDADRRYRFANRVHCEDAGVSRESIIGRAPHDMPSGARLAPFVELALAGEPQTFELDEFVRHERRTFEHRLLPDLDGSGQPRGIFALGFDVTERVNDRRALERQGDMLNSITEAVADVIMVVDAQKRLRYVNGAFERWCGIDRQRVEGRTLAEALGDGEYLRIRGWAERALAGERVQFERDEHGDGHATHRSNTYIPLRLANGRIDGFVAVAQDVTAHRREQARLTHLAQRDPLTGLLNRAGFGHRMDEMLSAPGGGPLALLYIDLDRFKPVNDLHGHPVGDQLLQLLAQRLEHLVRPTDAVARLGGDEFAILLGGMRDSAHALAVAEKVVAAACTPFEVGTLTVEIGASVGVAHGLGDPAELAACADAALYEAKRAGRGCVREAIPERRPARTLAGRAA